MPDLDGFIQLNDAQIRSNESQARIADELSGIPQKLAQADLTEQQAVHQSLENVAKALDIQWDAQAHDHLLRRRTIALQQAKTAGRETEHLTSALGHVSALLAGGGDWSAIRDGWIALGYLRGSVLLAGFLKAAQVQAADEAYSRESWKHPTHSVPVIVSEHDPGSLLEWARQHTCYPKWGSAAAVFVGSYLQALADSAAAQALALKSAQETAEKAALELEKLDWDRLNERAA